MLPIRGSRVLVTGAGGFIGFHLTRRLIEEGAEVHIIHRPSSKRSRLALIEKEVTAHAVDLRDFNALCQVVKSIRPQKIFHLAASTNVDRSLDICAEVVDSIIIATLNLIRALENADYEVLVNTGSSEEYGDNPAPFVESQMPIPVSPYSAAKVSTTMFCQMFYKCLGLPMVTLRPFLTYGPYQDPRRFIPQAILAAIKGEEFKMTAGEQTREFNFVEDIVDGYIRAATTPEAIGRILNLGNGMEYTLRETVQMIFTLLEARKPPLIGALPYRPGEAWHFYSDSSLARQILGWQPKYNLEEGLRITINWYKTHYHEIDFSYLYNGRKM